MDVSQLHSPGLELEEAGATVEPKHVARTHRGLT